MLFNWYFVLTYEIIPPFHCCNLKKKKKILPKSEIIKIGNYQILGVYCSIVKLLEYDKFNHLITQF